MSRVKDFGFGFETIDSRRQIAYAQQAEEMGFGAVWIPEDYFFRGAFSLASAIACATTKMRVGIGVLNPYTRHPVLTAMEFATLMEISEGRAILGVGASVRHWINQMRLPYTKPAVAMRELVQIVRKLFRGEAVSFEGKVFQTDSVKLSFPVVRAEVPIHLGVIGPKNLELAGEISDGVLLSGMTSPAYARFAVEHVRRGAERAGRKLDDLEVGAFLLISVSENEHQAREAVKPIIATLIALLSSQPESPVFAAPGLSPDAIRPFGEAFAKGELAVNYVTDWMIDTFTIAGGPERCRERLAELVEAGVRHPVAFEIPGISPDVTLAGVHRHLMPHFL